jgi:hypothetical protein
VRLGIIVGRCWLPDMAAVGDIFLLEICGLKQYFLCRMIGGDVRIPRLIIKKDW